MGFDNESGDSGEGEEDTLVEPKLTNYYFSLKSNEVLDVDTLKKENFNVTTAGTSVPVVGDISYLPADGEVRVYLTDKISEHVTLNPYLVSSTNLKNIDGGAVSLSESVYLNFESDCDLYDISIVNVWYKKDGVALYKAPESGPCDLSVRVLNSSNKSKTACLKICTKGSNEASRLLAEENISLTSEQETIKDFTALEFSEGEMIEVYLEK
ncbi:MAG: hypothetical protein IKB60_05085 [Clostridia bacterium]|nr:hypothetical protein [Clostridia bacterium]